MKRVSENVVGVLYVPEHVQGYRSFLAGARQPRYRGRDSLRINCLFRLVRSPSAAGNYFDSARCLKGSTR